MEVRLRLVRVIPKIRFDINPPTIAPSIPNITEPSSPPCFGWGSRILAIPPANPPKIIQAITLTLQSYKINLRMP